MAEVQQANTSIYGNIQAPKQMSLADMLNLSKSGYELSKMKELYPSMIEEQKAKSESAQSQSKITGIELEKSTQANEERKIAQSLFSDPSNYLDKNGNIDVPRITKTVNAVMPYTGSEYIKKYTELAQNQSTAASAKTRLTDEQRGSLGSLLGGMSAAGIDDPKKYAESVQRWADQHPGDKNIQDLASAYIGNLKYAQPGDQTRLTAAKAAQEYKGSSLEIKEINGIQYQYNPATNELRPIGGGQQPQAPMQGPPPIQSQPSAQPQGSPSLIQNEVPVGQGAGPLQLNAQQKELYNEGFTTKSNAQSQVIPAKEGRQTVRRVKELADQAASSKIEQLWQRGSKAILGNTELDELTKNIANLQIQNAAVMGVKTDQQTQNVATASGSVNISPEALRDIADRTDASNTAVIKFNEGLKNYEGKRGQTHAYVNTRNFKDAWASNYDPRVFMIQNINSSGMTKDKKQEAIDKVVKGLSEDELKDLRQKSEAIKRLERGDYR